jgi:hypothetical protein
MAFSSFANRLPDPVFKITEAGENSNSGLAGPGFASVKFSSDQPISVSRTNSGRVITRAIVSHRWKINITYNPMTRDEFEPVYNFLLEKRGRLKPFFVKLPQHSPRTTTSGTYTIQGPVTAGTSSLLTTVGSLSGGLRPGDMININDSQNSNHTKAYQIVKVNDSTNKLSSDSDLNTASERRLFIVPPLARDVTNSSTVTYATPLIRVIQTSDVQEYDLGTNNLYQFSLNLEEAQ